MFTTITIGLLSSLQIHCNILYPTTNREVVWFFLFGFYATSAIGILLYRRDNNMPSKPRVKKFTLRAIVTRLNWKLPFMLVIYAHVSILTARVCRIIFSKWKCLPVICVWSFFKISFTIQSIFSSLHYIRPSVFHDSDGGAFTFDFWTKTYMVLIFNYQGISRCWKRIDREFVLF